MLLEIGFINLNKPTGFTSHDCVAKIRRLLKIKRVGHGGTLDPSATGVLPIAVGKATRLLQFLPEDKAYRARIRLGMITTTDDLEGEILQTHPCENLSLEQIAPLLNQFIGKIEQIPPAYSAIHQGGKRLYELARKGEQVEIHSRTVEIHHIEILGWYPGEYPELEVAIACGSGTYIRAIARDLGAILNVGGTLAKLIRTESCGMKLAESLTFEELETQIQRRTLELIPPAIALQHLPVLTLADTDAKRWCQGQQVLIEETIQPAAQYLRIENQAQDCLGIGEIDDSNTNLLIIPKIVLV